MDEQEASKTEQLLAELATNTQRRCVVCSAGLCGHEYVVSVIMGFKGVPRCATCLARQLGRERGEFLEHVLAYVEQRDCFRAGWARASEQEGLAAGARPSCLWGSSRAAAIDEERVAETQAAAAPGADPALADQPAAEWDAGDMGCGDLVLELRSRLRSLTPGATLRVCARDPGAPQDIPAWCGLTGHVLLRAEAPWYWIRRKEG